MLINPKVIITTHLNADFDAISSLKAGLYLHPEAIPVLPGSTEKNIQRFLQDYPNVIKFYNLSEVELENVEEIIVVDTIFVERLGAIAKVLNKCKKILVYDHHDVQECSKEELINGILVKEKTGANTTMLLNLLIQKGLIEKIDKDDALLFALGIYEDTGSFTFVSTTRKDLEIAGILLEKGAKPDVIRRYLVPSWKPEHVYVLNQLLESAIIHQTVKGDKFVIAKAFNDSYLEELATLTHQIMDLKNIDTLFLLCQMAHGTIIIGRSNLNGLNVGEILRQIGGGGHSFSASATLKGLSLVEAENILIDAIKRYSGSFPKITDIMSKPPITIEPDDTISKAHDKMSLYGLSVLPVVKEDEVIGLISLRTLERAIMHGFSQLTVRDFMTTDFEVVHTNDDFSKVHEIIINKRQRFLPVVDQENKIIGVITRTDLIQILTDNRLKTNMVLPLIETPKEKNLKELLTKSLPENILNILIKAGEIADKLNYRIYVVGGFVRDLLLKRQNTDIDLVVEGDAIHFAREFSHIYGCKYATHERFKTATIISPDGFKFDVATARWEYYEYPAAMPVVQLSSIKLDLFRRDFTINTLAITLNPKDFGILLDFFGGYNDIKQKNIRVLHSLSFVDDPTRAYRAVRFESRFNFKITEYTLRLIRNAIRFKVFDKLAGNRLLNELKLLLSEEEPIPSIIRCHQLGLLQVIDNKLILSEDIINLLKKTKEILSWYNLLYKSTKIEKWLLYLFILFHNLKHHDIERIINKLEMHKLSDIFLVKRKKIIRFIEMFKKHQDLKQSTLYLEFKDFPMELLLYALVIADDDNIKRYFSIFISHTLDIKVNISGKDLIELGLKPGPIFSKILNDVLLKKIDGIVISKEDEINYVKNVYLT